MKILIINDTASVIGGAASVALATARILAHAGVDVCFFAASGPIDSSISNNPRIDVVVSNQPLFLDDSNRIRGAIRGLYNRQVALQLRILLKQNPDIKVAHVHSWTKGLSSSIFDVLRSCGIPTIITAHDYFLSCPNGGFYNYKTKTICTLQPLSGACIKCNCDRRNVAQKYYRVVRSLIQRHVLTKSYPTVVHVSEFSRKILSQTIPAANGPVIHNPISVSKLAKVDCPKNRVYAYIGRVDQEKGVELFCRAVTDLHLSARVIGTGDQIDELSDRYPNIQFHGWVPQSELHLHLQDVRCCVFPSLWYENAGLVPLEIMRSSAIPFIVSDRTAASEYIHPGKNGLFFQTGNLESLIETLNTSHNDSLIAELQENILVERCHNHYQTKDSYLQQVMQLYKQISGSFQKHED